MVLKQLRLAGPHRFSMNRWLAGYTWFSCECRLAHHWSVPIPWMALTKPLVLFSKVDRISEGVLIIARLTLFRWFSFPQWLAPQGGSQQIDGSHLVAGSLFPHGSLPFRGSHKSVGSLVVTGSQCWVGSHPPVRFSPYVWLACTLGFSNIKRLSLL